MKEKTYQREISPQFVSSVAKELDEKVKEFLNRPIEEELSYLLVDASYFKVRDEKAGRYRTKALLIVAGVRKDGYREILGLKLAGNEGEGYWLELFEELKERGLRMTNMLERVAKELKRRARVVGAFPNEESLIRLAGCILMDINEEWLLGRRYLNMDEFLNPVSEEVIENFTANS